MPQYRSKGKTHAQCPYYLRDSRYTITCAGFREGASSVMEFRSPAEKEGWMAQNCFKPILRCECPFAEWLTELYEKEHP